MNVSNLELSKEHKHDYKLSHTEWGPPSVQGGTALIGPEEYAYLVCSCTSVVKRLIEPVYAVLGCDHFWYKCEPETDDTEHCSKCGTHRNLEGKE